MKIKRSLTLECAYCYEVNERVPFNPAVLFNTFVCKKCGETNDIVMDFVAEKRND